MHTGLIEKESVLKEKWIADVRTGVGNGSDNHQHYLTGLIKEAKMEEMENIQKI